MSGLCGDCGAVSGCGCTLANGTGTTVTGVGSVGSPYAVNLTPQNANWLTDVTIASLVNRDALLWDTATSQFKNYKIGGKSGSNTLVTTAPAFSGTAITYSGYSTLTTVTNDTALTLNGFVVVTCQISCYQPTSVISGCGFVLELNGADQTIVSASIYNYGATTLQWAMWATQTYAVTIAPAASVTFRLRLVSQQSVSGGGMLNSTTAAKALLIAA